MTALELLQQAQGDMSRAEYAARLGFSKGYLDKLYMRNRPVTLAVLRSLAQAFPSTTPQVLALFFAPEYDSMTVDVSGEK